MGLLAYIKSLGISQPSHWLKYGVTNSLGEFSELFMNLWIWGQLRPVESGDTSWQVGSHLYLAGNCDSKPEVGFD